METNGYFPIGLLEPKIRKGVRLWKFLLSRSDTSDDPNFFRTKQPTGTHGEHDKPLEDGDDSFNIFSTVPNNYCNGGVVISWLTIFGTVISRRTI